MGSRGGRGGVPHLAPEASCHVAGQLFHNLGNKARLEFGMHTGARDAVDLGARGSEDGKDPLPGQTRPRESSGQLR